MNISDGLIGLWRLDIGSGLIAFDESGYGNNGALEGTDPSWVDGINSKAINFPGVNERIDCGNGAPLDQIGDGDFSISFWMRSKDTVPLSYGALVAKWQVSIYWELYSHATANRLAMAFRYGGLGFNLTPFSIDTTVFDTFWHHIVLVIDRTIDKALCYVDSIKDNVELDLSALPFDCSSTGSLSWGARNNGVIPYEGILDELRVYNRVLTKDEIDFLYKYPSGRISFEHFIEKIDSEKIALLEIDLAERREEMLPYEAGIWQWKLTDYREDVTFNFQNGSFTYGAFKKGGVADLGENGVFKIVSSLQVDEKVYLKVSSLANLRTTNKSFFYEADTIIYIHFDNFDPPDVFSKIELGITYGFSTKDIYLADNFFEGRINSMPQISFKKDPLYAGILRYGGGNVGLINHDGFFDKFIWNNIFGQAARIKFGGGDLPLADYKTQFTGFVEDFDITNEMFTLRISDYRKKLSRNLPPNTFDIITYPDIKSRNAGKPIALLWGPIKGAPAMCTNEKEDPPPADYNFKFCDTEFHSIKEITAVYVKGIEKTPTSTSQANAAFSLAAADYNPGDKVTIDFSGYDDSVAKDGSGALIQKLDIIKDMLANYLDITYSSDTYNTTEWEAFAARDTGLYIGKKEDVKKAIERICLCNFGCFMVEGDGRFTFRKSNVSAAPVKTIEIDEELTRASARYNSAEYLTSLVINYDKDQGDNEYVSYPYKEKEAEVFLLYKTYREKEFNTILTSEADALALALDIMSQADRIRPVHPVTAKTQAIDLRICDNIVVRVDRRDKQWYGLCVCEVIGIGLELIANKVQLDLHFINTYSVGRWMADSFNFPAWLGGADASVWDKTWSIDKKIYAKNTFGYWTDDEGYIDPEDPDSYMGSMWGKD